MTDDPRALGALGALILELYARQMALFGLLRSRGDFTEKQIRDAIRQAHQQLAAHRGIATLRSQASGHRLEEIEQVLRTLLFPSEREH